jgi:hypothetical protein
MTNPQPAELAQPSMGPLHNPAALVAWELASVLVPPVLVVLPIGHGSVRYRGGAGVRAADRNRSRDRQSPVLALAAGDLWVAERGLRRAWLPQA